MSNEQKLLLEILLTHRHMDANTIDPIDRLIEEAMHQNGDQALGVLKGVQAHAPNLLAHHRLLSHHLEEGVHNDDALYIYLYECKAWFSSQPFENHEERSVGQKWMKKAVRLALQSMAQAPQCRHLHLVRSLIREASQKHLGVEWGDFKGDLSVLFAAHQKDLLKKDLAQISAIFEGVSDVPSRLTKAIGLTPSTDPLDHNVWYSHKEVIWKHWYEAYQEETSGEVVERMARFFEESQLKNFDFDDLLQSPQICGQSMFGSFAVEAFRLAHIEKTNERLSFFLQPFFQLFLEKPISYIKRCQDMMPYDQDLILQRTKWPLLCDDEYDGDQIRDLWMLLGGRYFLNSYTPNIDVCPTQTRNLFHLIKSLWSGHRFSSDHLPSIEVDLKNTYLSDFGSQEHHQRVQALEEVLKSCDEKQALLSHLTPFPSRSSTPALRKI